MESNYKPLGQYIEPINIRNEHLEVDLLLGVSIKKCFIPSIANTVGTDMSKYKIVKNKQFAYGPVTSRNGDKISIALLEDHHAAIVSSSYTVFEVTNHKELDVEYLMMWFRRPEFDRYARFKSHGSTRETFNWDEMCEVELPVPNIEDQRAIIKEYNTIVNRITLNEELNKKLEETAQTLYKHWFVDFEFSNENGQPYQSSGGEMVYNGGLDKEIPKNWEIGKFVDILFELESGKRPPGGVNKYTDGIPSIGAENIQGLGKYNFNANKFVPLSFFENMSKGIIKNYDVLLYKDGVGVGNKSMFGKNFPFSKCCINEHVFILRTNEKISQSYLYFWLAQRWIIAELISASLNSAQQGLNQNNVNSIPILIPPPHLSNELDKIIIPLIDSIFSFSIDIKYLNQIKEILLYKMSKLEMSDSAYIE